MTQNYKLCPKCNNALDNNVMQCPYCGKNLQINIGFEKISGNTITTLNQKKSKGCVIFFIIFFIIPFIGSVISLIIGLISSIFQ